MKIKCPHCCRKFASEDSAQYHIEQSHPQRICDYCGKTFLARHATTKNCSKSCAMKNRDIVNDEFRKKVSNGMKKYNETHDVWNKGKFMSEKSKIKLSKSLKKHWATDKGKEQQKRLGEQRSKRMLGKYNPMFGKSHKYSIRQKLSEAAKMQAINQKEDMLDKSFNELLPKRLEENNLTALFKRDEFTGFGKNTYYLLKCNKCDNDFKSRLCDGRVATKCPYCYKYGKSYAEIEILNYLKTFYKGEILHGKRKYIDNNGENELDIYLPEKQLAIEYNGLYYHSDRYKDKYYHINKTKACKAKGIRLIHIFEDEWLKHQDIVKSRLRHIIGQTTERIYARNTTIKPIETKNKNKFLNTYHIQGEDKASIKLGAYYNDELVAVMTFCKPRACFGGKKDPNAYELSRFCPKYSIIGIASKMMSHFKANYEWNTVYTYADMRWSDGNVYEKMGMKLVEQSRPNYWYIKGLERFHRFAFRKDRLVSMGFD